MSMVGFSIPFPVSTFAQLPDSSSVLARNMVTEVDHPACGPIKLVNTPIKYSEARPGVRTPPPTLGQHTDEILANFLQYTKDEISQLKTNGVVA